MSPTRTPIFRHWYWLWLINIFFVGVMIVFYFLRYPAWFHNTYRGISLSHEMNYAVWWSGICLFIAALVFARVGTLAEQKKDQAWIWYVMALAMIALSIDEVGSLHEGVSRVGGWTALLPFALVFAVVFGLAFLKLIRTSETRLVALLILLGIGIFVIVAGLEFLEHDHSFRNSFWRRTRQVGEETIELIAMGILITAGLVAMRAMGDGDRRYANATAAVNRLFEFPFVMFALFIFQMAFTVALVVPNYTYFPEGNPSVLFPLLLFFCLGIIAQQRAARSRFWFLQAVLFYIASILQMYNLNVFLNHLTGVSFMVFTGPPATWMATLVPFLTLGFYAVKTGVRTWKQMAMCLILFGLVYLLVYPDLEFRYRIEILYFLFSSCVSYTCYQLMAETGDCDERAESKIFR